MTNRDGVDLVGAIDYWTIGQRVGANGGDDEDGEFLAENGTASRQAVGRRTDGRADDEAVAGVAGRHLAVDDKVQRDHVKGRARQQSDLVESEDRPPIVGRLD